MVIDTIDTLRFLQDIFVPFAERKNPTNNKSNLQIYTYNSKAANLRGSKWIYSKAVKHQLRTSDNDAAFSWDAGRDEPFGLWNWKFTTSFVQWIPDDNGWHVFIFCSGAVWTCFYFVYLFVGTTDLKAWKIGRIYLAFFCQTRHRSYMHDSIMIPSSLVYVDYWWLLMFSSQCASCSCKTGSYCDCTYLVNAKSWEHWHTQFVLRLPMPYLDGSVASLCFHVYRFRLWSIYTYLHSCIVCGGSYF